MVSTTTRIIYCTNPSCTNPINPVGESFCANCQTQLVHNYLWASGFDAGDVRSPAKIADRYEVIAEHIWLDTHPGLLPDIPEQLPAEIIPYQRLYPLRLHLPIVYGFTRKLEGSDNAILLLENVPIDKSGNLYPAITDAWEQATPVRQVYWLWQILQLWSPLSELKVAGSLLLSDNLRIQGWCVRLLELRETQQPNLQQLGEFWQTLVENAKPTVAEPLQKIVHSMRTESANLKEIATQLNRLLLSSAAELPLILKVAGATDPGLELTQNEDNCFPTAFDSIEDPLLLRVSIVCDGIGGHEGGEVASQLAVQSVKLQIRALLTEVAEQPELVSPQLLEGQLEACLRVVNNLICNCNNEQKREGTQRMGTTLVMAVQVPQGVESTTGYLSENANELYLANVGDSRAYWITPDYCQQLTVDDDVTAREVRNQRSLYRKALLRPDATALTQALGTKDGEFLRPVIQRFIIEEDGILLLASDGLSDNNWVEQSWQDYAVPVLRGELSLEEAVYSWIKLANQKNGHDNTSVVLTHCRVSCEYPAQLTHTPPQIEIEQTEELLTETPVESEFTDSSQALLDLELPLEEAPATPNTKSTRSKQPILILLGLLVLLVGGTSLGLLTWRHFNPGSFQRVCRQLPTRVQGVCLK
jgi:protein phosphatase